MQCTVGRRVQNPEILNLPNFRKKIRHVRDRQTFVNQQLTQWGCDITTVILVSKLGFTKKITSKLLSLLLSLLSLLSLFLLLSLLSLYYYLFFHRQKNVPVTVILSPFSFFPLSSAFSLLFSLFDTDTFPPPTFVLLTPFYYLPR